MSTNPASTHRTSAVSGQVVQGKLWWAGLVAIAASVIANLIVQALMLALLDLPADFPPLQAGSIALFTAVGVGLGVVVFAIISRLARQPIRTFRIVALAALIVSILPNLLLMANPASAPFPGGTALGFGVLIVFHVVAAAVSVTLLTRLART